MNLFLKGPSGSGKTYNSVQTVKYFPKDDAWFLGGLSPKALIHDYGVLLNKDGEEIDLDAKPTKPRKADFKKAAEQGLDPEEELGKALLRYKEDLKAWREELQNSYRLIDLSHKILIFLEAPDFNTYRMLLPILSHDTYEITYKFTDKTAQGSLRTIKVVIRGWPATIFLTTDRKYMEELATRSFTVTPETSTAKIKDANELTNTKDCYPWNYSDKAEETRVIEQLVACIKNQFTGSTVDSVVPFTNIHELFPAEIVRDMRDFAHFMQFLKTVTALHFYQRPFMKQGDKRYLMSTVEDVQRALEVYKELFETTRTGTEQRILDFYHDIVSKTKKLELEQPTGSQQTEESTSEKTEIQQKLSVRTRWHLKELTTKYNETSKRKLSSDSVRVMLDHLSVIGYVDVEPDPGDKRCNLYSPLLDEEKAEIHREFENPLILGSKLEKGFEEWEKNTGKGTSFYYYKNFSEGSNGKEGTWGEQEVSIDGLKKIILTCELGLFPLISETDSGRKTEKKSKIAGKGENQQSSANSTRPAPNSLLPREMRNKTPSESKSDEVCEVCGKPATTYVRDGVHRRCSDHLEGIDV
jgi:DNA-binding MarR family transcriptional regulator